jgi:DNA-binding transcriptional ArsR family regulator
MSAAATVLPGDATDPGRAGAEPSTMDAGAPQAELIVSDAETLRAIADPLRLAILEVMVTRAAEPWSVKELAAALAVPQTRLYHHIDLLVERDLIRPASQRLVSGIVETRYRVAALSLRLDPQRLSREDAAETTAALVANLLDAARNELLAALRAAPADSNDPAPDRPLVTRGMARLTPERAAELRARLVELVAEFDDADGPDAVPYGFLLGFYRATIPAGDPT